MSLKATRRMQPAEALPYAVEAINQLDQPVSNLAGDSITSAMVCGSLRRRCRHPAEGTIGDIDVIVTDFGGVASDLSALDRPGHLTGKRGMWGLTLGDQPETMPIDVYWCPPESVGPFLWYLTGPPELNVWMRKQATACGMFLSQYGLFTEVRGAHGSRTGGARLDRPPWFPPPDPMTSLNVPPGVEAFEAAERLFWDQWGDLVGVRRYPPQPWERNAGPWMGMMTR